MLAVDRDKFVMYLQGQVVTSDWHEKPHEPVAHHLHIGRDTDKHSRQLPFTCVQSDKDDVRTDFDNISYDCHVP